MHVRIAVVAALVALTGCSKDEKPACTPGGTSNCEGGQVCELVAGTTGGKCFDPLVVRGRIYDLADDANVSGARVTPLDVNGAPAASTVTSASTGDYSVRVFADRNADGSPAAASVTLRVEAATYQSFPSGLRVALPIALDGATHDAGVKTWIVDESLTDVGLLALAGAPAGQIHGTAAVPAGGASILVVAECGGVGFSSIASSNGAYRIFNLPDGDCTVAAYSEGVNYDPVTVTIASGNDKLADLSLNATAAGTVTGSISIVNGGVCDATSVILVVRSTFDATTARGEAPAGLRAAGVNSTFSITGVPAGEYAVLAGFENDDCVRDLSGGGGTEVQYVTVTGGATVPAGSFKMTEALVIHYPGASGVEDVSSATPSFSWVDDSGEDSYLLEVYDSFGEVLLSSALPKATGADPVFTYPGTPALVGGMIYQFRVFALNNAGETISSTENLKGVFRYVP